MAGANLAVGWLGILLGMLAGALAGLFFWREDWLGGYGSWRRRMTRLAHISLFGLGIINIAFALTVSNLGLPASAGLTTASIALDVGAATMPAVCWLAAWRQPLRQLFPVPVVALLVGVALFAREAFLR